MDAEKVKEIRAMTGLSQVKFARLFSTEKLAPFFFNRILGVKIFEVTYGLGQR